MPRARSVKSIIAEVVMYVGMFAVVGHMSQNLYERFLVKSELSDIKSDLNSLELIVYNIGLAYDTLREDLQALLGKSKPLYSESKPPNMKPIYGSYLANQNHTSPTHSYTQSLPMKQDAETNFEKFTKDFMQNFDNNFKRSTNNFIQYWRSPAEDKTTITESLVKCINVGVNRDKDNKIKDVCKCIVKCISHEDDNYKLVNLHEVKYPSKTLSPFSIQRLISTDTNSNSAINDTVCNSFQTL